MSPKGIPLRVFGTVLLIATSCVASGEGIEDLEIRHASALRTFESETRTELTRIARDKSVTGEEKIILIEKWFAVHAPRVADINRMADSLDELKPIPRVRIQPNAVIPTPENLAAANLHNLNPRFSNKEISLNEVESLREPIVNQLAALQESKKQNLKRLPAPPLKRSLNVQSSDEDIANELHAQNRYLASLPEDEAQAVRKEKSSGINSILRILEQKEHQNQDYRSSIGPSQRNQNIKDNKKP